MKFFLVILPTVLLLGCSRASSPDKLLDFFEGHSNVKTFQYDDHSDDNLIRTREVVFGDVDQIYVRHNDNFSVDDSGRVYIESQKSIYVYDSNGDDIGIIGKEGRGPGEFLAIHNMSVVGGMLYVFDANQSKISVFNTDSFELSHEVKVPLINDMRAMGDFAVLGKDSLVVGMRGIERKDGSSITQVYTYYHLMNHSGEFNERPLAKADIVDFYEIRNQRGVSYPHIPFDRSTLFSFSVIGKLYLIWTGEIAIKVLNSKGNYINGFFYPYPNARVKGDSDFPVYFETLGFSIPDTRQILGDRLPESHPAVSHFFVDGEERIWVSTIIEDADNNEWWVLQDNGELVRKFKWPIEEPIEAVKNGRMYTRKMDEESGSYQVNRYRIEFDEDQ